MYTMEPIIRLDKVEIYQCRICSYGSLCLQSYMNHINKHLPHSKVIMRRDRFYKCKKCPSAFMEDSALILHKVDHVINNVRIKKMKRIEMLYKPIDDKYVKRFSCSECNYKFVLESTLKMHMALHEPFPNVCSCGIGFYKENDLLAHEKLVHKRDVQKPKDVIQNKNLKKPAKVIYKDDEYSSDKYEDGDTDEEYNTKKKKRKQRKRVKSMVKIKLKTKYGRKGTIEVSCNICDEICPSVYAMKRHASEMHAEVPYSCIYCKLRFTSKELLSEHKTSTHSIPCHICDKHLMNKASLSLHLKTHSTSNSNRPHVCLICNKGFTQGGALTLHLKRHAGVKDVKCKYCDKEFYNKSSMELHARVHTKEKPLSCRHCNKPFADPSALARHIRIHTKDYRYCCEKCPKKFTDLSSLIRHRKKHSSTHVEITFKCDVCGKTFSTKQSLQSHVKRHKPNKKYECHDCGKRFACKPYLSIHIQNSHSGNFKCVYCGSVFKTKARLHKHKHTDHSLPLYCDKCPKRFRDEKGLHFHKRLRCTKNSQKG